MHTPSLLKRRKLDHIPWIANPIRDLDDDEDGTIQFHRHEEATTIELFYDLFFVANLTTFTNVHEINDRKTLSSYVGFFAILWFTWLQTSLFDVRFARDSVFERTCKAIQFAVWTGFAAVGSAFNPNDTEKNYKTFRDLSVLLFLSRALLVVEYGVVLYFVFKRKHKQTVMPLAGLVCIMTCTAVIYIGLYWTFKSTETSHAYIAWYVTLAVEAVATFMVSTHWRILSFKHTHLVERMGLLTLIILGEGIIGMTKTVNAVVGGDGWTRHTLGQMVSVVVTIYFLWMLYFDHNPKTHYGTIRQQFWAFMHFPFHVGLVLLLEGLQQFTRWRNILYSLWALDASFTAALNPPQSLTGEPLAADLNATINEYHLFGKGHDTTPEIQQALHEIANSTVAEKTLELVNELFNSVTVSIFTDFGVEPPEHAIEEAEEEGNNNFHAFVNVFKLVYVYFFLSTTIVVLMLAVFMYFVRKGTDRYDWMAIGNRFFVAAGLGIVTALALDKPVRNAFMGSSWILPTVAIALAVILCFDRVIHFIALQNEKMHAKSGGGSGSVGAAGAGIPLQKIKVSGESENERLFSNPSPDGRAHGHGHHGHHGHS